MKLLHRKLIWLVLGLGLAIFSGQTMAQSKGFSQFVLSAEGQKAYRQLFKVELFAFGGVGFAGGTSEGETALGVLVKEKKAIGALRNLVSSGSPEGGLYALAGLKMLECDCFYDAFLDYKNLAELAEKEETLLENGEIDLGALTKKSSVQRMAGCLVFYERRLKVAENIEKGTDATVKLAIDNFRAKKG